MPLDDPRNLGVEQLDPSIWQRLRRVVGGPKKGQRPKGQGLRGLGPSPIEETKSLADRLRAADPSGENVPDRLSVAEFAKKAAGLAQQAVDPRTPGWAETGVPGFVKTVAQAVQRAPTPLLGPTGDPREGEVANLLAEGSPSLATLMAVFGLSDFVTAGGVSAVGQGVRSLGRVTAARAVTRASDEVAQALGPVMGPQTFGEWRAVADLPDVENVARVQRALEQGFDPSPQNYLYHVTQAKDFDATLSDLSISSIEDRKGRGMVYFNADPLRASEGAQTKAGLAERDVLFNPESAPRKFALGESEGTASFPGVGGMRNTPSELRDKILAEAEGTNIVPVVTNAEIFRGDPGRMPAWAQDFLAGKKPSGELTPKNIKPFIPDDVDPLGFLRVISIPNRERLWWSEIESTSLYGTTTQETLKKMGFDGLEVADEGGVSVAIFADRRHTIRSPWAQFNPTDWLSPELSAAFAGALGVGVASGQRERE